MGRQWRVRILACLGVAAALVAGCSQKQEASTSLPTTSGAESSSTLPALGPADLPMPNESRQQTSEGFNAFSRYYIGLINRLESDLNPAYLREFSRNCETCDRIANDAERDNAQGYTYHGGKISITDIAPARFSGLQAETAFTVDQDAYTVVDAQGIPVPGLSSKALTGLAAGMSGTWAGDHWIATNLSFG